MIESPANEPFDEDHDGRTDLVFEYVIEGNSPETVGPDGASLLATCAYYGDVSAMKYLVAKGASLKSLGDDIGLNAACFHGHWRLCEYLVEQGADVNRADPETEETPLHSALSQRERLRHNLVVRVLLSHRADPNQATKPNVETGAFMRDCRTKGETPLHRAAAFADEEAIQLLLNAGAKVDAKDMNGESPLSWASWYGRPVEILRKLLYGPHRIHPQHAGMEANLLGKPLQGEDRK